MTDWWAMAMLGQDGIGCAWLLACWITRRMDGGESETIISMLIAFFPFISFDLFLILRVLNLMTLLTVLSYI